MSYPLVTILSPTYNHEKYIGQCIDSVLIQTFQDWEMIILNDGSSDQTKDIAELYASKDKRIQVVNQKNVGVFNLGDTYNKGLKLARGKYIAILEGDDTWHENKLETQVSAMEADPEIVLCWSKADLVDSSNTEIYYTSPDVRDIPDDILNNIPTGSIIQLSLFNAWLPALTLLIRKQALDGTGGFIQSHGMPLVDFPTILALSLKGKFHFFNGVLGKWRIYATQTTKKHTVEIYEGMLKYLHEFLPQNNGLAEPVKEQIIKHYKGLCLIAHARSGRYKLIRKEFKSARHDYLRAITYPAKGRMLWRFRAVVGYVMSIAHLDVEWLAKLLGKKTYK